MFFTHYPLFVAPLSLILCLQIACHAEGSKGTASTQTEQTQEAPFQVKSHIVSEESMPRFLDVTGTLLANQHADVAANASGKVVQTFIERGQLVEAGEKLIQLDHRGASFGEEEARANLELATAQMELADKQCKRNQELYHQGAISKDEWDKISSNCRTSSRSAAASKARAELALKNVNDATIFAPFTGYIEEKWVNVSEYVQPSSRVVSLVELNPIRLQMTVAEADFDKVVKGQKVNFKIQTYPERLFQGTLQYIGAAVRPNSRDILIEALVNNEDHHLRPGMFAEAKIILTPKIALAIPKNAIRQVASTFRVFVIQNHKAEERLVQIGSEKNGLLRIDEGLKAQENVILDPPEALKDGSPVQ